MEDKHTSQAVWFNTLMDSEKAVRWAKHPLDTMRLVHARRGSRLSRTLEKQPGEASNHASSGAAPIARGHNTALKLTSAVRKPNVRPDCGRSTRGAGHRACFSLTLDMRFT